MQESSFKHLIGLRSVEEIEQYYPDLLTAYFKAMYGYGVPILDHIRGAATEELILPIQQKEIDKVFFPEIFISHMENFFRQMFEMTEIANEDEEQFYEFVRTVLLVPLFQHIATRMLSRELSQPPWEVENKTSDQLVKAEFFPRLLIDFEPIIMSAYQQLKDGTIGIDLDNELPIVVRIDMLTDVDVDLNVTSDEELPEFYRQLTRSLFEVLQAHYSGRSYSGELNGHQLARLKLYCRNNLQFYLWHVLSDMDELGKFAD